MATRLGLGVARADWQLVWSDEFTNNTINTNNWTFDIGNGPSGLSGWGNNELEYYTSNSQNAYVSNGLLHIVALKQSYGGQNYTSARLKTLGLFSQTLGRFEFSAKLPAGQGYWPALWMLPLNSTYGGWAASGEIDVMENRGSNTSTVLGTIHYGGSYPAQTQSYGPSFVFPQGDSVTNFHVYALEWYSNSINWIVDGTTYEVQTNWYSSGGSYPAPFNEPFYILMNLAVGGDFGGNPTTNTVFPGDMQVDYVRVYKYVPGLPPIPTLKLRYGFEDAPGTNTLGDTTSAGTGLNLHLMNGSGNPLDLHGTAGSGVSGGVNGNRALDLTSNGANQPGNPGPAAFATDPKLGYGVVTNFVFSLWYKQHAAMAQGANVGPRLFVLGGGSPSDAGSSNSIGLKFQSASQIYLQVNSFTLPVNFPTNVATNSWLFMAGVYDGAAMSIYQGSDTASATLATNSAAVLSVDFGTNGSLCLGNRQNLQRSFDGWIDDFRFYTGSANASLIEAIRQQAVSGSASSFTIAPVQTSILLNWMNGQLQSVTNIGDEWTGVSNGFPPYVLTPNSQSQFFRVKLQ